MYVSCIAQKATDFSGMKTADLAKECDMTIGPMSDDGNVVDYFGDKQGLKFIHMYQAFVKYI